MEARASADANLGEARHEFFFGRRGRAELQGEVQEVDKLERGLALIQRSCLDFRRLGFARRPDGDDLRS